MRFEPKLLTSISNMENEGKTHQYSCSVSSTIIDFKLYISTRKFSITLFLCNGNGIKAVVASFLPTNMAKAVLIF
jgi:hypothetical protein